MNSFKMAGESSNSVRADDSATDFSVPINGLKTSALVDYTVVFCITMVQVYIAVRTTE